MNSRILAVAGLGMLILGCSSGSTPAQRSNAEACGAYVAHLNEMPCAELIYDTDNLCGGAEHDVDMAPYLACLTDHARCEGERFVLEDGGCEPPLVALAAAPAAAAGDLTDRDAAALRSEQEDGRR